MKTAKANIEVGSLPLVAPLVREPVIRYQSQLRDGVARKLAVAEARIAELESALRKAGEIASHDPLTGVLNRRGMNEAFARETARAMRVGRPLVLVLVDLDDFKAVNDRHGHGVGDAALVHLTRVMGATLRPTDICCRLGGEEFVVLMPGCDRAAAVKAMTRLQAVLAAREVPGAPVTLAFSAGVVLARSGESLAQLLARADRRVYRAKAAGKGRIVSG
jgi:diguanylate cyclase